MNRISALSTREEIDLEERREELRNLRWGRRGRFILSIATLIGTLGLASDPATVIRWL